MSRILPAGVRRIHPAPKPTLGSEVDKVINAETSPFLRFVIIGLLIATALWALALGDK